MDNKPAQSTTRRNDPCPCGSGKKYKNCCGSLSGQSVNQESPDQDIETAYERLSRGDRNGALSLARSLVERNPNFPEAHALIGTCYYGSGNLAEARKAFLQADKLASYLRDRNDVSKIKLSLSTLEHELGNYQVAEAFANDALGNGLDTAAAHNQLGVTLAAQNKFKESIAAFEKSIELNPRDAQLWTNKGSSYYFMNDSSNAAACFNEALEIDPNYVVALRNLAKIHFVERKYELVFPLLEKAIHLVPGDIQTLLSLALTYKNNGEFSKAKNILDKILAIDPVNLDATAILIDVLVKSPDLPSVFELSNKINQDPELKSLVIKSLIPYEISCAFDQREIALGHIRQIKEFDERSMEYLVANLLSLNYTNTIPPDEIFKLHTLVGTYLSDNKKHPEFKFNLESRTEKQKYKIGYISPDFRDHSVGFFIRNVIASHDKDKFEIYCYADTDKPDFVTEEISENSYQFRNISDLNNEKVASLVHSDQLDIFVDLAGYTGKYRLPVFAYKPAPIQVTYLGYPNTTGMKEIDFRITDDYAESSGGTLYTEELIKLPESFLCFGSFPTQNINPIPAFEKNGFITFGSFNNIGKLTKEGIAVWANILQRCQDATILLKNGWLDQELTRENIFLEFENNGVSRERVRLQGYLNEKGDHLDFYNNIDIALDTFPFNGATTTCEALWMGVPVITLVGKKHAQRVSYSILKNIGHEELAAKNEQEYIDIACMIATDKKYLKNLKLKIPSDLSSSILCSPTRFTKQLENTYQSIMQEYIGGET